MIDIHYLLAVVHVIEHRRIMQNEVFLDILAAELADCFQIFLLRTAVGVITCKTDQSSFELIRNSHRTVFNLKDRINHQVDLILRDSHVAAFVHRVILDSMPSGCYLDALGEIRTNIHYGRRSLDVLTVDSCLTGRVLIGGASGQNQSACTKCKNKLFHCMY